MNGPVIPSFVYKQYKKYVRPSSAGVGTEKIGQKYLETFPLNVGELELENITKGPVFCNLLVPPIHQFCYMYFTFISLKYFHTIFSICYKSNQKLMGANYLFVLHSVKSISTLFWTVQRHL